MSEVALSLAFMTKPAGRRKMPERPVVFPASTTADLERLATRQECASGDLANAAEVYCRSCHLATPSWRKRCIHCTQLS